GAARPQAARGLSADPLGRDRVEGLARLVLQPRAARQGGVASAHRRQRPRRSQRIERALKLAPGAAPELDGGPGKQLVHPNKAAAFCLRLSNDKRTRAVKRYGLAGSFLG